MSTWDDLPASFEPHEPLSNPQGNGPWSARYTPLVGEQTISWLGAFADVLAFRDAVFFQAETITVVEGPPTATVTRAVPLQCPYDPALWADDLQFRALSAEESEALDAPPWKDVIASVHFGVVPYATTGATPFLSARLTGSSQRRTIPNFAYTLVDDSNAVVERLAQDVALPVGVDQVEIVWHEITDIAAALALCDPLRDTVNQAAITLPVLGRVCPPGTFHFLGVNAEGSISNGNVTKASLVITGSHATLPWNKAIGSAGVPLWIAPAGSPALRPIPMTDHSILVRGY